MTRSGVQRVVLNSVYPPIHNVRNGVEGEKESWVQGVSTRTEMKAGSKDNSHPHAPESADPTSFRFKPQKQNYIFSEHAQAVTLVLLPK